jgi:hypothetical protein
LDFQSLDLKRLSSFSRFATFRFGRLGRLEKTTTEKLDEYQVMTIENATQTYSGSCFLLGFSVGADGAFM